MNYCQFSTETCGLRSSYKNILNQSTFTYLGEFFYGDFHPIFHFRLRLMQLNESEVILATWVDAVNFWSNKFLSDETWQITNLIHSEIVRMVSVFQQLHPIVFNRTYTSKIL